MVFTALGKTLQLPYILLLLSSVAIIVHVDLVGSFRISDLLLILSFLAVIPRGGVKKDYFIIIISILGLLTASLIIGTYLMGVKKVMNGFFFFKTLLPFLPPIVVYSVRWNEKNLRRFHRVLFYTFLFLMLWIYLYVVLRIHGLIGGGIRPQWPFSTEWRSDGHQYSSYLSLSYLFFMTYWRRMFNYRIPLTIVISLLTVGAIILTASRTGIVLLVMFAMLALFGSGRIKLNYTKKVLPVLFLIFMGFSLITINTILDYNTPQINVQSNLDWIIRRAFTFDLINDDSSGARIRKLVLSFEQSYETGILFGPGVLGMRGMWYDGLIAQINAMMGGLGVVFFLFLPIALIYKHWKVAKINNITVEQRVFALALTLYFLANLITEYFLLTRNVLTISIFLSLLSVVIFNKVPSPIKNGKKA